MYGRFSAVEDEILRRYGQESEASELPTLFINVLKATGKFQGPNRRDNANVVSSLLQMCDPR